MIKIRSFILSGLCVILFYTGITGCMLHTNTASPSENQHAEATQTSEIISPTPAVTSPQESPSVSPSNKNIDDFDYGPYLKKIWIVQGWDGHAYKYSSFYLTHIENGVVAGKLSTRSVAIPDNYLSDLKGTIYNGAAECWFSGENGDKGTISILFKENNEIEATIDYETLNFMSMEDYYNNLIRIYKDNPACKNYLDELSPVAGTYLFKPYNLSNISVNPSLTHSFETDLDSWGHINFVTVVFNGNKPHPTAYLTTEHNDILYEFGNSYHVGTKIIDVFISDLNEDGLNDVKLTTGFFDYDTCSIIADMPYIEWVFYQMEDGLFSTGVLDME